ncbi:MAG: hypothetical protein ABSC94_32045 [Polyangiaceae bacterium]|jgi:hypothetical protein
MAVVSIRRRVRPLRFAFLVDHRDPSDLRVAIRVNTILWAGMFNSIVPIFKRTPASWRSPRTAGEIVRGYLDAFEPDFIIAGSGVDASTYGVPQASVSNLAMMLTREGLAQRGMDVMDVYRWRYQRDFRFVHRDPIALHYPAAPNAELGLFGAAVFGEFPGTPLDYFEQAFRDLGGKDVPLTTASYRDTLRHAIYPLSLGMSGLDDPGSYGPRRTFFLLNPKNVGDLIDFWNLRALGWRIVAVPVQWTKELAPQISKTIQEEHQQEKAHVLKGRSVSDAALQEFAIEVAATEETVILQPCLPRIWEPEERDADRTARISLSAGDDETQAELRDDWLSFDTVGPAFTERNWTERPRVANVIGLRSFDLPEVAGIVPKEISDLDGLLRCFGQPNMIRNSSEGLAILTEGHDRRVTWRLPHGIRVFAEWFKPKGELQLSGAGKIAKRMIRLVGGPEQARLVTTVDLVSLFDGATGTASRDVPHRDIFARLMKSMQSHKERVERRIEALVRQRIIKLGVRLPCDQCAQQNWFALDELRDHLTCQWCLDELPFPTAMPPKQPCWSYRPLGPFAAKGCAQGAYVVAAAIRIFHGLGTDARTTWVPSFTLKGAKIDAEVDFAMFWQSRGAHPKQPQLLLGECKTFDKFKSRDIRRMKSLAEGFPGAVLVFATFNERLTDKEKKLLASLAAWGRKRWRNAVVVLGARELTSDFGPPYCWHDSDIEREKELYEAVAMSVVPHTSLRRLADATQQLYLDMSPDVGWPHYDKQ